MSVGPVRKRQAKQQPDDVSTQQFVRKAYELSATEKVSLRKGFDLARERYPELARRANAERDGSWRYDGDDAA
jgi:hypothetical protein